jgi:2-aminomuconate deaminase
MTTPRPESVHSRRAPDPVGAYPHAKRFGNLLFLSGVGPRKPGSNDIPGVEFAPDASVASYDIRAQAESCFENIRIIIEDAGASWENILDVQVFLTSIRDDFQAFNEVYAKWFGDVRPARTTVEVGALPTPINVELKVIAAI